MEPLRRGMNDVGILAYGSLIRDPGIEIADSITRRVRVQTPFGVEFGRYSKTRGGAPTLVPRPRGRPVSAEILVLREGIALDEARDLLWRREARKEGTGLRYPGGRWAGSVLVNDCGPMEGLGHVLYTDFHSEGKIQEPDVAQLAERAIASVAMAPIGKDGITYLMEVTEAGVETALSRAYEHEILRRTSSETLAEALIGVGGKREWRGAGG